MIDKKVTQEFLFCKIAESVKESQLAIIEEMRIRDGGRVEKMTVGEIVETASDFSSPMLRTSEKNIAYPEDILVITRVFAQMQMYGRNRESADFARRLMALLEKTNPDYLIAFEPRE